MKTPSKHSVEAALLALASVDADHASTRNGAGFNGSDTRFCHSLVKQLLRDRDLSEKQRFAAWKLLEKYKNQLSTAWGIDYDQIPTPEKPTPVNVKQIDARGGLFVFQFPFDRTLKDDLKESIPGRRWDDDAKVWTAPGTSAVEVGKFALRHSFAVTDAALAGLQDVQKFYERDAEAIAESAALDADIEIPGLLQKLRAFQRAGVKYALKHLKPNKGVYIADEMGLGKTPQSLAVLHAKDAFPALIAVPRVVWLKWAKEVQDWIPNRSVVLMAGRISTKKTQRVAARFGATVCKLGEPLPTADIYIVKYSVLYRWTKPVSKKVPNSKHKKTHSATGELKALKIESVIFDEAHYLKEESSQRTKAALAICTTMKPPTRIALSGTPIPNRPLELIPVLNMLNRMTDIAESEWDYRIRFCNGHQGPFGWDFSGSSNLEELNRRLRANGYVRRDKKDVLTELPPLQFDYIPADLENQRNYDIVHGDLKDAKREYGKAMRALDSARGRGAPEAQLKKLKSIAKAAENQVGVLSNLARKTVGQEKLKFTIEWIEDFLENTDNGDGTGEKLIVFGYHRDINEAISQHFDAPLIYGNVTEADRQESEDKFQNDPKCRVLVAQIEAAGVGVNLTAASHVVFVELPYRPMDIDQAIARAYGRLSDVHGVNVYFIVYYGDPAIEDPTIDEHILNEVLDPKRADQEKAISGSNKST